MAYTKKNIKNNQTELLNSELVTRRKSLQTKGDSEFFYELEAAIVIDVIRDENHPIFKKNPPKVEKSTWPNEFRNASEKYNDPTNSDYSWIGRIRVRMINSQQKQPVKTLDWVTPIETGVYEYPLLNEVVIISKYMGRLYYTRRLNTRNFVNNSADFQHEIRYGQLGPITKNVSPGSIDNARNKSHLWPDSNRYAVTVDSKEDVSYLGKYFKANNKIRPLMHYEGDTIIQSRFGSSIRFGAYENNPDVDIGTSFGYGESYDDNLGNPMILIRNRQKVTKENETKFQYNIIEDVNEDGSSIQITSGRTLSKFVPTLTHTYDHVPYGRRGCIPKSYNGLDGIARSKIGNGNTYVRSNIIDRRNRN